MPKKVRPASDFGRRLVELRKERGITQTDLADLIGSTQRAISHYETEVISDPRDIVGGSTKSVVETSERIVDRRRYVVRQGASAIRRGGPRTR